MAVATNLRALAAVLVISLVSGGIFALPAFERLRGLSIDVLTAMRWVTFGALHDPEHSPTVVIGLDEETYTHAPFKGTPSVTWTGEIARVLDAVVDGGAAVVAFDIVFPTSIEHSEIAFGGSTLGATVRGFDRPFLRALAQAARNDKIVLGQVQHQAQPIAPSVGQRFAVGHQRNIRPLNLYVDPDEIARRVPLSFRIDGIKTPSLAVELASRKLEQSPQYLNGAGLSLGGYRVPVRVPNTLALNFEGGADDVPTYSLADLRACVDKADTAFFRRHFEGRVVIFGAILDTEDRVITSKRFATGIEGARAPRCVLPTPANASIHRRDSIAGAYVHATAVNNLLRHNALREVDTRSAWAVSSGLAFLVSAVTLTFSLPATVLVIIATFGLWSGLVLLAFSQAVVLPFIEALAAAGMAAVATGMYRLSTADREKQFLRRTFSYYIGPDLVERMLASNKLPQLGGELRTVTVYCSDLQGFTPIAEKLQPDELVALMNEYLTNMTDIISQHGGFVDKFIGDAIVAVFGAPLDDPDHARHAVQAALACQAKLDEMQASTSDPSSGVKLRQRIGLHTGEGLVGNIGSKQRFNYTVMGDVANLAARLEGANKFYGTTILASQATARQAGDDIVWRELDEVCVVGRTAAVRIFEPWPSGTTDDRAQTAQLTAYAEGLSKWRGRDFEGAAAAFSAIADIDRPASIFCERARKFALNPPAQDWRPVNMLDIK